MRLASPLSTSIKAITGVGINREDGKDGKSPKMLLATGKEYFMSIQYVREMGNQLSIIFIHL